MFEAPKAHWTRGAQGWARAGQGDPSVPWERTEGGLEPRNPLEPAYSTARRGREEQAWALGKQRVAGLPRVLPSTASLPGLGTVGP